MLTVNVMKALNSALDLSKKFITSLKKDPSKLICVIFAAVFVVGMVFATIFDFKLSAALTNLEDGERLTITVPIFALIIEIIGEWPSNMLGSFCAAILMRACIKVKKPLGYAGIAGFGAIAVYFVYQSVSASTEGIVELANGEYGAKHLVFVIPLTVIIALALFIGVLMLSDKTAKKLLVPCIVCGAMLALMFVGIQGCKLLWGRVRMRQLIKLGDLSLYSPWYKMHPFSGYRSFPSGHTANAVSLGLLPLLYGSNINKKFPYAKKATYIAVAVWGAFMAFTRILVGAHFLSDVLCGAAIAFVCVILGHYFMDKIRKS